MPRRRYEKYALASALTTYLRGKGWKDLDGNDIAAVRIGFQSDVPISVPLVSVYFLPSSFDELEIGRTDPYFTRRVQVDAYMEDEPRAESIGDDIGDFFDLETVTVIDPVTASGIATLRCMDSTSIIMDTLPPNMSDSKILRWREVVKATVEVDY
jgi:hypothetical protein